MAEALGLNVNQFGVRCLEGCLAAIQSDKPTDVPIIRHARRILRKDASAADRLLLGLLEKTFPDLPTNTERFRELLVEETNKIEGDLTKERLKEAHSVALARWKTGETIGGPHWRDGENAPQVKDSHEKVVLCSCHAKQKTRCPVGDRARRQGVATALSANNGTLPPCGSKSVTNTRFCLTPTFKRPAFPEGYGMGNRSLLAVRHCHVKGENLDRVADLVAEQSLSSLGFQPDGDKHEREDDFPSLNPLP